MRKDSKRYFSEKDIERFAEKFSGKRANDLLSLIGMQEPFFRAMDTDIGKELLTHATKLLNESAQKFLDEKATPREQLYARVRFNVLKEILEKWGRKIDTYYNSINTLKTLPNGKK